MIKVIFKNVQPSPFLKNLAEKHFYAVMRKFTTDLDHKIDVIIGRESKQKSVSKIFSVKLLVSGKKYKNIKIERKTKHLYEAIKEVADLFFYQLNKVGDKKRVIKRQQARKVSFKNIDVITEHDVAV